MIHRSRVAAVLLAGAASTALALATVPAANAATFYTVKNLGSGMCLQPPPGSVGSTGVQLVQEPCDGSNAQHWSPISLGGGNYRFSNQSTGGCLNAHGPNADRTPVDTWPCNTISNERWNFAAPIPNSVPARVVSAIGSRCLDVTGGSSTAGARVEIYHCTSDNSAQAWTLQAVS